MTPQEKAKQLVDKMLNVEVLNVKDCLGSVGYYAAIECALIAVDEILNNDGFTQFAQYLTEYWLEVKKELEEMK